MKTKPNQKADKQSIITVALLATICILSAFIHPILFVGVTASSFIIGDIIIAHNKLKKEENNNGKIR